MNATPILSIVMPVYNTDSELFSKCVAPFIQNDSDRLELIIVDDGSNSETAAMLDELRYRVPVTVMHERNSGQNGAREIGVNAASGLYVGFLDSDDRVVWDNLNRTLDILEKSSSDIVSFDAQRVSVDGQSLGQPFGFGRNTERKRYISSCAELWLQFFRKSFLLEQGGLFRTGEVCVGEDLATVLPMAIRANSIEHAPFVIYQYVQQPDSVLHKSDGQSRMSILRSFDHILEVLTDTEVVTYHDEVEWQSVNHILNYETRAQFRNGLKAMANVRKLWIWVESRFPRWRENPYIDSEKQRQGLPCRLALGKHFIAIAFYQTVIRRISGR